jgi:hypothetical protein
MRLPHRSGRGAQSNKNNRVGAWRSLVAHLHGVQGVGGSNPLAPINDLRAFQKLPVSTFVSTFKIDSAGEGVMWRPRGVEKSRRLRNRT